MLAGHFIDSAEGQLFITQFGDVVSDTAVLCLPSIIEEMNFSRAVVAKQAQRFAKQNLPCFILDYYGTGDSEGEFEQANADIWLENIIAAGQFLQQQGVTKIILWGIRFGALLILSHQAKLHQTLPIFKQILWKPVTQGKLFTSQFLRLKQAKSMMTNSAVKVNWREFVLAGNNVEVSGYLLTKTMLQSMELLSISPDCQPLSPIAWFELAAKEPTPITKRLLSRWDNAPITVHCLDCPAFWQVPEIFSLAELEHLTMQAVLST